MGSDTVPEHPERPRVLALPRSLDPTAAEALCRMLRERLLAGEALRLDAGAVAQVSTICVQVLVAAARSSRARGIDFEVLHPSATFAEAVTQLGLQSDLVH